MAKVCRRSAHARRLRWSLTQRGRSMAGAPAPSGLAPPQRVPTHAPAAVLRLKRAAPRRRVRRVWHPALPGRDSLRVQPRHCELPAPRCVARPPHGRCLHPRSRGVHAGFTSCDCKGQSKRLEIRVAEADLLRLVDDPHDAVHLLPPGFVVDQTAPAAAPVLRAKRPPPVAAPQFRPNPRFQATNPDLCSECGGRGGLRASLLRCVACDAAFHGKCGDVRSRSRGSELVLCPSCYHAQF